MENSLSFHAKEKDTKFISFIDASSSFFVVEATGDSEMDDVPNVAITDLVDDDDDDDDAESSSCDVSDHSCVAEFNYDSCEKVEASNVNVVVDEEEEDQQELVSAGTQADHKSCVSFDSTNETMNEMEKNRLFWEACLAS